MENNYTDQEMTCACGNTFVFTAGEQVFFAQKGLAAPKRCKKCRLEKRRQREMQENAL